MNEAYSGMGREMGLNQVAKMGIILEPLILFLLREPLIPDTNQMNIKITFEIHQNC